MRHEEAVKQWRKRERERLIAARLALDAATIGRYRGLIDAHLERAFPQLAESCVAFCWPIRNEYDARHLARRLRAQGATTALPVVVARGLPLIFRDWHSGVPLAQGALGIPHPVDSREVLPDVLLLPVNGFDALGYRLGYGGGFFDRTLAVLARRTISIGIGYELARIDTVHPQSWDMPLDWLVTERGVYRREAGGLAIQATRKLNPCFSKPSDS